MPRFSAFDLAAATAQVPQRQVIELTFAELLEAFVAAHPNDSYARLRKWADAFGARSAWAIPHDDFARAADAMVAHGYSHSSVNRDLSAIGSAYKWAIHARRIAPPNFRSPTRDIPRRREPMRVVTLTAIDEARLRAAALAFPDRRFGLLVHLLLDTGARPSEILARTWTELNPEGCEVVLRELDTKTGRARVLHYQQSTAELIRRLQPSKGLRDALAFEGRKKGAGCLIDYRKSWGALAKMIGRPEMHMYDCRHVAAARLLNGGASVAVAAQVLGHSSLILHKRYGHLEREVLKRAQQQAWAQTEAGTGAQGAPLRVAS